MKPLGMLIKYYIYCAFLSVIFGFNQYAFQIKIPAYLTGIITTLVLWGLIYNSLKNSEAKYSFNQLIIVMAGVAIPNSVALYIYPKFMGVMPSDSLIISFVSLLICSVIVWCLFFMSKSMVLSAPVDDDYDS
ncbi:MAG: hypothetical protein ACJAS1_001466 [Oleiphilaceae bacterium]|jgi:hypothetical protein